MASKGIKSDVAKALAEMKALQAEGTLKWGEGEGEYPVAFRKGFFLFPKFILDLPISAEAQKLYCILLDHCFKGDTCYPGQKRLGEEMRLKERQIKRLQKQLQKVGLVTVERTGRSNIYTVWQLKIVNPR